MFFHEFSGSKRVASRSPVPNNLVKCVCPIFSSGCCKIEEAPLPHVQCLFQVVEQLSNKNDLRGVQVLVQTHLREPASKLASVLGLLSVPGAFPAPSCMHTRGVYGWLWDVECLRWL